LKPKEAESHHHTASNVAGKASVEPFKDNDLVEYAEVAAYVAGSSSVGLPPILDSGASHHMVNDKSVFNKIKDVDINIFTGGLEQQINATAVGETFIWDDNGAVFKLNNVLLVPHLHQPLISMNGLFKNVISVYKTLNHFSIRFNNNLSLSGSVNNNIFQLNSSFVLKNCASAYSAIKEIDWHARLGHPGFSYLKKIFPKSKDVDCNTCKMCKGVKVPFKGKFAPTLHVLEAVHLDLVGPFQTRSVGGAQYFLTIVDQHSGFKTIKLMRQNSDKV
jgi:hypothetical protein